MEHSPTETLYLLEELQPFSQSLLWDLQRAYFTQRGAEAWRQGEVPHYITSNPTIAAAYAKIIFSFWQDLQRIHSSKEPIHICELGAGSGRFAFHFLSRLVCLCEESGLALDNFRYVLTDFTQSNLEAWRSHPRFQAFFDCGVLDMALFDISQPAELALQLSGNSLSKASLERPLVLIANYVFDSVPQELFYFKGQVAHRCLISLATEENPENLDVAELLERLCCRYDYQALNEPCYPEAWLQTLLAMYCRELDDAHFLFPAAGLRCLEHLKAVSECGLLLLSADKGDHRLWKVARKSPPGLTCHGSFSLSVNYHALQAYCQQSSGLALVPEHQHQSIEVVCLLMLEKAHECVATRRAYQNHIGEFNPDDFFTLSKFLRAHLTEMSVEEILAYLRFNRYDSHQLARLLPRLLELAPDLSAEEIQALKFAIDKSWEGYFSIREEQDLAFGVGCFFYELNDFSTALGYFQRTQDIYGRHTGALYNMAACHHLLGQPEQALPLLQLLLKTDPDNQPALNLLSQLSAEVM